VPGYHHLLKSECGIVWDDAGDATGVGHFA
jgi:hypothetical protein